VTLKKMTEMKEVDALAWAAGHWKYPYLSRSVDGVHKVGYREGSTVFIIGQGKDWCEAVVRAKLNNRDNLLVEIIEED
jgi:hypothetical protein